MASAQPQQQSSGSNATVDRSAAEEGGQSAALREEGESSMLPKLMVVVFTLVLGASCFAQEGFAVRTNGKQERPADAERIYVSACSAVERKFRVGRPLRPQLTLVIGADENSAYWEAREIRLTKWDPYMFAQGVVIFAFEDLLPDGEKMAVARRAISWANSTVDAKALAKEPSTLRPAR